MSEGLKHKYNITKSNGNPVDAKGVYFVLKLNSKDEAHKTRRSRLLVDMLT